jgi:hypothetical protein
MPLDLSGFITNRASVSFKILDRFAADFKTKRASSINEATPHTHYESEKTRVSRLPVTFVYVCSSYSIKPEGANLHPIRRVSIQDRAFFGLSARDADTLKH